MVAAIGCLHPPCMQIISCLWSSVTDNLLNERETFLLTYALNENTMCIVIITKAVIVMSLLQQPTVI